MPRRFGVRRTGVNDGRKLRKVVGSVVIDDRRWELLSCGHEGKPIGLDGPPTQRWCEGCKQGWPAVSREQPS